MILQSACLPFHCFHEDSGHIDNPQTGDLVTFTAQFPPTAVPCRLHRRGNPTLLLFRRGGHRNHSRVQQESHRRPGSPPGSGTFGFGALPRPRLIAHFPLLDGLFGHHGTRLGQIRGLITTQLATQTAKLTQLVSKLKESVGFSAPRGKAGRSGDIGQKSCGRPPTRARRRFQEARPSRTNQEARWSGFGNSRSSEGNPFPRPAGQKRGPLFVGGGPVVVGRQ